MMLVRDIKAKRFHSSGRNFVGGRVTMEGMLGSGFSEKLVLKMEVEEYRRFKAALREALAS